MTVDALEVARDVGGVVDVGDQNLWGPADGSDETAGSGHGH
jgi:hypothetical protein